MATFSKENISDATQNMWREAGLSADQTTTSAIDYAGATSLTLESGEAHLCSYEADGQKGHFARFGVRLSNGIADKESGKQLFRNVYAILPKNAEVKNFNVKRANGTIVSVKGISMPEDGIKLLRRFPSLTHQTSGYVPYKDAAQTITLKAINNAVVMAYDEDRKPFLRIVDGDYYVEDNK